MMKYLALFILSVETTSATTSSSTPASTPSSIPRSTNARPIYTENIAGNEKIKPPWNLSPNIDKEGFFTSKYKRIHGEWEYGILDYVDEEDVNMNADDNANHATTEAENDARVGARTTAIEEGQMYDDDIPQEPIIGGKYHNLDEPVYVRQVPGDGNCLFHSISVSLALVTNRTHIDMTSPPSQNKHNRKLRAAKRNGAQSPTKHPSTKSMRTKSLQRLRRYSNYKHDLEHLHHHSRHLRSAAVDILSRNPKKLLFLQGNEYLRARDLVSAAAEQYGMTGKEYCEQMRKDSYWGGGPEIVALCNYLKRPIHVYELSSNLEDSGGDSAYIDDENSEDEKDRFGIDESGSISERNGKSGRQRPLSVLDSFKTECNSHFHLRRMACFGSPKYDRREALHILSADSRFPDIEKGKQLPSGNHFLALFPETLIASIMEEDKKLERKFEKEKMLRSQRAEVRGGDLNSENSEVSLWTNGILKYCNINFILNLMHRLKLAFFF